MFDKYGDLIKQAPIAKNNHPEIVAPIISLSGGKDWGGAGISIRFEPITQPLLMCVNPSCSTMFS